MYFSSWMTDVHHSYWCYSISGLSDILVPPSITCTKWLSLHDNRCTGALLPQCRCFLCVCNKRKDQLGLCNNSISSHKDNMYYIKTKHLRMFLATCLLSAPTHTPLNRSPPHDLTKTPNAFDSLFVSPTHRLAVWKQTHIARVLCIPAHLFWIKTSPVVLPLLCKTPWLNPSLIFSMTPWGIAYRALVVERRLFVASGSIYESVPAGAGHRWKQ